MFFYSLAEVKVIINWEVEMTNDLVECNCVVWKDNYIEIHKFLQTPERLFKESSLQAVHHLCIYIHN